MNQDLVWDWRPGGFGLYVHWPFCTAKCPYCDFNSHVSASVDHARWKKALLRALAHAAETTAGRALDSIFFGGGTPSLMAPETVAAIVTEAGRHWRFSPEIEITLEANPTSVEADRFHAFADAGVNRVSIGIQSLRDKDLVKLGRRHSAEEARRAYGIARKAFERVSMDLIYARQDQTLSAWQEELSEAAAMGADHLSLYQLTIEPGTPFAARHERGALRGLPDDDRGADLYDATQAICIKAGLPAYEVSNHARPGQESRHNLVYWRQGDWAGIGPGAHGRLSLDGNRFATETLLAPEAWLCAVERNGHGQRSSRRVAPEAQFAEAVLMGLRVSDGIDLGRYRSEGPGGLDVDGLNQLLDGGYLWRNGSTIGVTSAGRLVLNRIVAMLLHD